MAVKIRIEPLARTVDRLNHGSLAGQHSFKAECQLKVALEPQRGINWCWAAVANGAAAFYGDSSWSQERIVWQLIEQRVPPSDALLECLTRETRFHQPAQLEDVLRMVGCLAGWSGGRPPFRRLVRELDAGRPVAAALDWGRGGRHFVLVSGYRFSPRMIHLQDPQTGSQCFCFDNFPQDYRDGGAWAETYWTSGSPNQTAS